MLLPGADPGDQSRTRLVRNLRDFGQLRTSSFPDSPIRKGGTWSSRPGRPLLATRGGDGSDARPRLVGFADTWGLHSIGEGRGDPREAH